MSLRPPRDLPAELQNALIAAQSSPVLIKLQSYNDAVSLRHKLVSYLRSLEESYEGTGIAAPFSELTVNQERSTVIIRRGNRMEITTTTPPE